MDVPTDLCSPGEMRIGFGGEAGRDIGRDDAIDEFIDAEGGEDLMSVEGKSLQGEWIGDGCCCFCEEARGRERVPHGNTNTNSAASRSSTWAKDENGVSGISVSHIIVIRFCNKS